MKHVVLAGLLISALGIAPMPAFAQETSNGTALGSVTLTRKVLADGQPLAPGTYQVRLGSDQVKPVVGESPNPGRSALIGWLNGELSSLESPPLALPLVSPPAVSPLLSPPDALHPHHWK